MNKYSNDLVDKIINYKSISNKDKINRLLSLDANQYCNLGIDSTKGEKEEVKKNSRYIYRAIQKIDQEMGSKFLHSQDR